APSLEPAPPKSIASPEKKNGIAGRREARGSVKTIAFALSLS
ncbi:hypothetical protein A2U01_0116707, partial [Trifolium medium]|nr:hypothetical protein [Trifolium medium]